MARGAVVENNRRDVLGKIRLRPFCRANKKTAQGNSG
jgi:hypothetical protein